MSTLVWVSLWKYANLKHGSCEFLMENLLATDDIFQASRLTYRTAQNIIHNHVPTRQNTERCSCTKYMYIVTVCVC